MALNLKLKYFVPFEQLMGKTESFPMEDGATVKDLLTTLSSKYAGFSPSSPKRHLIILLNGTICTPDDQLSEGDEISILTPQIGG